jgi:hypothetical protein
MPRLASTTAQIPEYDIDNRAIPLPPPATPTSHFDDPSTSPPTPTHDTITPAHPTTMGPPLADTEHGRLYGTISGSREPTAPNPGCAPSSTRKSGLHRNCKTGGEGDGEPKPKKRRRVPRPPESLRTTLSPTLMLVNSGSVARDHLASERTFLAYVRTSLAMASMGVGESASELLEPATSTITQY